MKEFDKNNIAITNITDFSGIWSKEEAEEIERIITESCETIHPDDWR